MTSDLLAHSFDKRADIINLVRQDLWSLQSKQHVNFPILNIYGISGMGKTWVIQELARQFQDEFAVVWLSFDAADKRNHPSRMLAWSEIITQLRQVPALEDLPSDINLASRTSLPSDGGIIHRIGGPLLGKAPTLLLLDALDDLADWKWVQEQIIKPLLEQSALVVCTSQSPLFWHFWELREQCQPIALMQLTQDETHELLTKHNLEMLSTAAYHLTQGYPLVLNNLIAQLQAHEDESADQDSGRIDLDQLQFSQEMMSVLLTIGMMRRVDIPLMEQVLKKFLPGFGDHSRFTLLQTLTALRTKKLVISMRSNDSIKAILRQSVIQYLFQHDSARYYAICTYLAEQYYQRAQQKPKTEVKALIEWLYFSTQIPQSNSWQDDLRTLFNEVQRVLSISVELSQSHGNDLTLVVLFFTDNELIRKLSPKQYEEVVRQLQGLLMGQNPHMPLLSEFTSACSDALEEISARLAPDSRMNTLKGHFESSIKLLMQDEGFDIDHIRSLIRKTKGEPVDFSHKQITDDMMFLMSRGLLSYDRKERKYHVNSLLQQLFTSTRASGA